MGRFDDLIADLPPVGSTPSSGTGGRFDDLVNDLPPVQPQMGGSPPLGFVASQVANLAPWNKVNAAYKRGIGNYAEFIGKHTSLPPWAIASGTLPLAMAPELLGTVAGWEGAHSSTNPVAKGLLNSPKELSPEYDTLLQNPDLNISSRTPELGGGKPTFPNPYTNTVSTRPPLAIQTETAYPTNLRGAEPLPTTVPLKYPGQANDPRAFINYANARIQGFGDKLSPQEISDYGKIISDYYRAGIFPKGSPLASDGAKLSSTINDLQNTLIPGRQGLDTAYRVAKMQQAVTDFIKKAGLYTRYAGELGAAGYGAYQGMKKLLTP